MILVFGTYCRKCFLFVLIYLLFVLVFSPPTTAHNSSLTGSGLLLGTPLSFIYKESLIKI